MAAPDHVLYDDAMGQEFVYRQPKNSVEVDRLLFAAWNDPCRHEHHQGAAAGLNDLLA